MTNATRTMTLNLTDQEMAAVERYASQHQMSKTAVLRQALRLYDLVQHRLADGETFGFSGDQARVVAFAGIGFHMQGAPKE
jgi:hypothetical protein